MGLGVPATVHEPHERDRPDKAVTAMGQRGGHSASGAVNGNAGQSRDHIQATRYHLETLPSYGLEEPLPCQTAAVALTTKAGVFSGSPQGFPFIATGASRLSPPTRAFDVLPDGRFVGLVAGSAAIRPSELRDSSRVELEVSAATALGIGLHYAVKGSALVSQIKTTRF